MAAMGLAEERDGLICNNCGGVDTYVYPYNYGEADSGELVCCRDCGCKERLPSDELSM